MLLGLSRAHQCLVPAGDRLYGLGESLRAEAASSVLESLQESTRRAAQSMTATK